MRVVLIGAGNLATNLAIALKQSNHDILQVYSRTIDSASLLANKIGCGYATDTNNIVDDADLYVVSVKDSALSSLIPSICKGKENKIFIHTAGSVDINVFKNATNNYGVLYPLQTFSKSRVLEFNDIPIFVEANNEYTYNFISDVAKSISNRVYGLSSEDRKYLHLSAVFACNFVNHCYALSANILREHGIPFDVILPLIDETSRKVHSLSPIKAQTGPAIRFDENIINKQLDLLKNELYAKSIYDLMCKSIHHLATENKK
jgi:predicted short-subunit dehydrogenase-like oxidoreductase (DUF2520 family)